MDVLTPYRDPPGYGPSAPADLTRCNRSSSSPSTVGDDGPDDSDAGGSSEGSILRTSPERCTSQPGQESRGLEEEEVGGGGSPNKNSLNNERTHANGCFFLVFGDAHQLGTPLIEQLLSRSGSSSSMPVHQVQNNNNNNHNMQEVGMEKPSDDAGGAASNEDLAAQLYQLQGLVKDMRDGLTGAIESLSNTPDRALDERIEANKAAHDQQLADVLTVVLALKMEVGGITTQLTAALDTQQQLRGQVDVLRYERDILLEELESHGVVTEKVRQKYNCGKKRPNGLTRANDSTLSVLLERARTTFSPATNGNSDQDSGVNTYHQGDTSTCGEVTPPNAVSPMVQSYIAGLPHDTQGDIPMEEHYDSDCSITAAANKSLDMSRSLGEKCIDRTTVSSTDDDDAGQTQSGEHITNRRTISPNGVSSSFKRPASPKRTPPHEKSANELARLRVAREILDTERKYCLCLWTILDHFANPLKEAGTLTNKEISMMFPESLSRVYEHHCAFLQRLEECIANWRWHGVVGDIFSAFIDSSDYDVLIQYRAYVNEFPIALTQLKKSCQQSLRFRKFIRKCQQDPVCEGLDLAAFLLTPVQRIPRYVLLLKELLKYTVSDHVDYYYIEACLAKLGTFLTQLNDSIEYSMKVVANDATPKIKRKIRMTSVRSSGSSCDAGAVVTPRDSGVQSAGDNASILSASSSGRMFQLSVVNPPLPDWPLGVPPKSDNCIDNRTMPSMGTRRQRERLRGPRLGDIRTNSTEDPNLSHIAGVNDESVFIAPRQTAPRTRPLLDANGLVLPNSKSEYRISSPPPGYGSNTLRPTLSVANVKTGPMYAGPIHSTPQVAKTMFHKSLSHLPPPNYGVCGNDDAQEENVMPIAETTQQRRTMMQSHRSRSQGHLTFAKECHQGEGSYGGSIEGAAPYIPSQTRINHALAHGQTDAAVHSSNQTLPIQQQPQQRRPPISRPRSCVLPSGDISFFSSGAAFTDHPILHTGGTLADAHTSSESQIHNMRPRAVSQGSRAVGPGSMGADRVRENVWNDPDASLNASDVTAGGRRKDQKKKKKDKQKKLEDSIVSEGGRKKTGLKDSLKNIFFKKRKGEKEKTAALHDVVAVDTDIMTTSIKKIPFNNQDSMQNIRPNSARSPSKGCKQGTLFVRNGRITLEHMNDQGNNVQDIYQNTENTPNRLKKRPHSVCYGAVTCTPQEKKSSLKSGPSRSSLRWSLSRPINPSILRVKSGSKVVEIGQRVEYAPSPGNSSDAASITHRQAMPPVDESLIITARGLSPDFNTYEDENGDPCSAV